MVSVPHTPLRPLWLCRSCAAPWPCAPARLGLRREYADDRVALLVYMGGMLHDAAGELHRLRPDDGPTAAQLFARFLGWATAPRNARTPLTASPSAQTHGDAARQIRSCRADASASVRLRRPRGSEREMAPRKVSRDDLAEVARAALGSEHRLVAVHRIAGGTRKGVYRLTMDDATTVIVYLWEDSENYWPAAANDGDPTDPFSPGLGLDLFEAAHARLRSLGLRVPDVHQVDRTRSRYPADLVVLEDFPGENLMDRLARDPKAATPTIARLAEALVAMRRYRAPAFGKVAVIDGGGSSRWPTCEAAALDFGLRCLDEAAARDRRIAAARDDLAARLRELAAAVRPRTEYSVVHGELGLDHVLVDQRNEPVLIDIEDLLYFDVEWEHVFLRIRLGRDYERLAVDGLDKDRIALYLLVQRLSLTAGPLRLLDGDFPDRAFMSGIAEHNLTEALACLSAPALPPESEARHPGAQGADRASTFAPRDEVLAVFTTSPVLDESRFRRDLDVAVDQDAPDREW